MTRRTATTDGLAELFIDHEEWDLWVDVSPNATAKTWAEITLTAGLQGLCLLNPDTEMRPEHIEGGLVRHYLGYTEVTDSCP
ncbi:hypothetical protein [Actinoplanes sp. NPDC026670]|uniref:hypothetical protein n=1 Tax=Actinoplanes sp. NPDC026670 TaxID=3154700 RepID=UPI0033DECFFC